MSEFQRSFSNRRKKDAARAHATGSIFFRYLLVAGAFLLLIGVFFVLRSSGSRPETVVKVKFVIVETSRRAIDIPPVAFDSASYYQAIIENNLFRPLGWTPPRPIEPYRLLGTILPRDGHIAPQAIIQVATTTNKAHIVSVGETLDADSKIVDIQPKQVTLEKAGQRRTLKLDTSPWISTSKGRFSHRR